MLQDMAYGRLENEFRREVPSAADHVICVREGAILLKRASNDTLEFPTWEQVSRWAEKNNWNRWTETGFQYVFRIHGENYFLWMGKAGEPEDLSYGYENARFLRQLQFLRLLRRR